MADAPAAASGKTGVSTALGFSRSNFGGKPQEEEKGADSKPQGLSRGGFGVARQETKEPAPTGFQRGTKPAEQPSGGFQRGTGTGASAGVTTGFTRGTGTGAAGGEAPSGFQRGAGVKAPEPAAASGGGWSRGCLLYTSDAADD